MPAIRHMRRSFLTLATVVATASSVAADQENSVQRLLERGALQEAVERASSEADNVESTYLAAQALLKMDNSGGAEERFGRLREAGDDAWRAIGDSGAKLLAGDVNGAMDAANRAVAVSGDNPFAHYQLGLAAVRKNDFRRATDAFIRATELKPDFAYAYLYAGQAAQKLRQTAKMAELFQQFLRLAPEAPERSAVQSVLRSVG